MHKVRAAIVSGGASAYRLIASKGGPRRRQDDAPAEPSLDPRLVARANRERLSRQELAAALHNLRDESAPDDGSLAHWVTTEDPGEQPLLAKGERPIRGEDEDEEASLEGEIIPRRVSRTADTRREDRVAGAIETAVLSFRGSDYEVRVVNTSARGLQVESELNAHIAEELTIRVENGPSRPCYVRWIRGGRIGLGFREKDLAD
jgi:hypothetical protein